MLAITTYATQGYCYAAEAQAPLVIANLRYADIDPAGVHFFFIGDASKECGAAFDEYERRFEKFGAKATRIKLPVKCANGAAHAKESNLVIARMQQAAFDEARCAGAARLWSLEADILPPSNALRSLIDALSFDRGYYDVAMCTYPNSAFLGGYATPENWILPNVYPDERDPSGVPMLAACVEFIAKQKAELAAAKQQPTADQLAAWRAVEADLEACPPAGNVFERNAKGWRPRGWFEEAYPGIGKGAILPTFWVGMGCNLLSRRALDLAQFIGYDGGCTQDLWLGQRCWLANHLNMAVISHAVCSHVKKTPKAGGKPGEFELIIHHATHQLGGPRNGHLNNHSKPWNQL